MTNSKYFQFIMDRIDQEFAPVRKSVHKVDSKDIIDDIKLDSKIKKIKLQKMETPLEAHANLLSPIIPITNSKRNMDVTPDTIQKKSSMNVDQKSEELHDLTFSAFKEQLLRQINFGGNPKDYRIPGFLENTSTEIKKVLKQSIIQKESHSMIVIGPRSNFKKTLVDHELAKLKNTHGEQFITVRLNGFLHSGSAAIYSIASQLEYELGRKDSGQPLHKKSTDLKISHGTLSELFDRILKLLDAAASDLKGKRRKNKSEKVTIVFIFDEIDQFTGSLRQTLLYNLFDMVENSVIPICILGMTTKLNILEFLENRVKSRFSQRILFVPHVSSFEEFKDSLKTLLTVDPKECTLAGSWNVLIENIFTDQKYELFNVMKGYHNTSNNLAQARNSLLPLIALAESYVQLEENFITAKQVRMYQKNQIADSMANKVNSLSDLEIALLIASGRVALKNDNNINFSLAFEEYTKLTKSSNTKFADRFKLWTKQDLMNVWESLTTLELIGERGSIGPKLTAQAVFLASNHLNFVRNAPPHLEIFQVHITLAELRKTLSPGSFFYSWTQL